MQRRIQSRPQETAVYQALINHKQATLNVILSRIPDISTFAQLGGTDTLLTRVGAATTGTGSRKAVQKWKAL
jgi:hypothetical protein